MSQSIKVPDLVDYPEFFPVLDNMEMFSGIFSYIIKPYDINNGINLYIGFRDEFIIRRAADFKSNEIDLREKNEDVTSVLLMSETLKDIMKSIRITDASFYFSKHNGAMILVDVMVSANKFLGPGMMRDLFSKAIDTQEVKETIVLDEDIINNNKGNIIKSSRFKVTHESGYIRPIYGII